MDATDIPAFDHSTQRRQLAEAPLGQGPPVNPVTAVLFNPTLLAKIRPVGEEEVSAARGFGRQELGEGIGAFRRVSKDARAAFDAAWEAPMAFGHQRHDFGWRSEGPSPSQALDWALGMLQRGRRPRAVRIGVNNPTCPEEWRQCALDLLQAFPKLSGRPGEGVVSLLLPPELLSPSTAPLIAEAFPNLSSLNVDHSWRGAEEEASEKVVPGLALLLGAAPGAEGSGSVGGAGGGPSDGMDPRLPRLTELTMVQRGSLPPGLASVLRQAPQLRTLKLGPWERSVEELASLTQLTALSLYSCNAPLLPVLTGALTRLTSLELKYQDGDPPLSPALFAPLQGLQRLELPHASLEVAGLAEVLGSLTRLSVGSFTLPAQELSQPLTSIPRWRLPAGLRELGLGVGAEPYEPMPDALAGLEPPAGLRFDRGSNVGSFELHGHRHAGFPDEEGDAADDGVEPLLPAAEEALCAALRFIRRHKLLPTGDFSITFKAEEGDFLLQPVGGAAGTGPGRPNHSRWLREVAALRPSFLGLAGVSLSYQDVEVMRDSLAEIEALALEPPCELPVLSLPLLAGLPRLHELTLDATPWAGDDDVSTELRGQARASVVALARALPEGRQLDLDLGFQSEVEAEAKERVQSMAVRAREEMVSEGVRSLKVTVAELCISLDSDASDAT